MTRDEKIKEALECAENVMEYAKGDAWERECTEKDRNRFFELKEELFPTPPEPVTDFGVFYAGEIKWSGGVPFDQYCPICNKYFSKDGFKGHLTGAKHKKNQEAFLVTKYVDPCIK